VPAPYSFDYAVLRVVPRVEREEFVTPWDVHALYLRASDAELNWAGARG